jgi:hypothetical protein
MAAPKKYSGYSENQKGTNGAIQNSPMRLEFLAWKFWKAYVVHKLFSRWHRQVDEIAKILNNLSRNVWTFLASCWSKCAN